jgi:shikimate dehydrogenase
MLITATTRLFALLGDPVRHSLSPDFQNAAFQDRGLDAVYVAIRCDASSLAVVLRTVALAGGGGNVTVPHKEAAVSAVDVCSDDVLRTGACNTFWAQDGRVHGDNTDVAGFRRAARDLVGELRGRRVLLLGAGGAARAAAWALVQERVERIDLWNRSPERAATLIDSIAPGQGVLSVVSKFDAGAYDMLVNATSLGLHDDDPLPWQPDAAAARPAALLDLVYRPGQTRLVHAARSAGVPATDGRSMLLHQGAAAFTRWTGLDAPIDIMRTALQTAAGTDD